MHHYSYYINVFHQFNDLVLVAKAKCLKMNFQKLIIAILYYLPSTNSKNEALVDKLYKVIYSCVTKGILYQLNSKEILCPQDEIHLVCTRSERPINWELSNSLDSALITLVSNGGAPETLGTSMITANISHNGSHYISYLNIAVRDLRELKVTCEGQFLNVTFFNCKWRSQFHVNVKPKI